MLKSNYHNHIISGTTYKPLLRKKGKQWIVLGMSALALLGFGSLTTNLTHASANNRLNLNHNNHTKKHNISTKNITKYAHQLHNHLVNKNAKYQRKTATVIHPKVHQFGNGSKFGHIINGRDEGVNYYFDTTTGTLTLSDGNLSSLNNIGDSTVNICNTSAGMDLSDNGFVYDYYNLEVSENVQKSIQSKDVKHIVFKNVTASKDCNHLFSNMSNLQSVDLRGLNTSNVSDMDNMFWGCNKLSKIDGLANLDTHNVKNMESMFQGDTSLNDVDMSNWNVGKLTQCDGMFHGCTNIRSLNLTDFDTRNIASHSSAPNHAMWTMLQDAKLEQLKLGSNTVLHDGTISGNWINANNPKDNVTDDLKNGKPVPAGVYYNEDMTKRATINYMYNGKKVGSQVNYVPQVLTPGNMLIPAHYHLTPDSNHFYNVSNNQTINVNVAPNTATDTINFNYNGRTIKSEQKTGLSDTNIDLSKDIPNGYAPTSNPNLTYDGKTHTVNLKVNSKTDTIIFKHGNQTIKTITKQGKEDTNFDVKSDIPSQYNIANNTIFAFDGNTHVVQLGFSRPNGNETNSDGTPIMPHMNPTPRPNGGRTVPMKFDTFVFKHGNQTIKSVELAGQPNSQINVDNLVPSQYNINSGTSFTFDGGTHTVQLGVSRPNGNKTNNDGTPIIPHMNPTRPNGYINTPMKTDVFNFYHGSQLIKSVQLDGQSNSSININSLIPSNYNTASTTTFAFDGLTHNINLGVSRPNGNKVIPTEHDVIDKIIFKHGNQIIKSESK